MPFILPNPVRLRNSSTASIALSSLTGFRLARPPPPNVFAHTLPEIPDYIENELSCFSGQHWDTGLRPVNTNLLARKHRTQSCRQHKKDTGLKCDEDETKVGLKPTKDTGLDPEENKTKTQNSILTKTKRRHTTWTYRRQNHTRNGKRHGSIPPVVG